VLVPDEARRSPDDFLDLLARERVTVLSQTPSAFHALAQARALRARELALRWVVFGGENLDTSRLAGFAAAHPGTRLVNMYGITETTVHVTFERVRADVLAPPPTPIGRPLDDLSAHVLDAGLRPVPPGCIGELHIGGAGLAQGYLNRPALTAERFVPDPFATTPGARLYRSGDRARFLADGRLEYHGRADQQVQLRGYRIELGEIEARLRAHPAVADACVLHDPAPPGRLIGCVALRGAPSETDLQAWLARQLPLYMVPGRICALESLPVTANGKRDRRALLALTRSLASEGFVAPRGPTEQALAAFWSELLGAERVGAHDDFFQLGGHSLLAARLLQRIGAELGVDLDLRSLFGATRLDRLAERIDAQRAGADGDALDRIDALLSDLEDSHE
jgi:acyl-coenzyme A synthetase/AMP-(fatty) acid ligase